MCTRSKLGANLALLSSRSDKVEALPAAKSKKDGQEATVEVQEKIQEDIDTNFRATVLRAVETFVEEDEVVTPTADDSNRKFRTRFICVWLLMNSVLALTITRLGTKIQSQYFAAILWITFGLSVIRISVSPPYSTPLIPSNELSDSAL